MPRAAIQPAFRPRARVWAEAYSMAGPGIYAKMAVASTKASNVCTGGMRSDYSDNVVSFGSQAVGNQTYFFDGEIRDTMSTHVAADHGADLIIASNSIQPYHYNETMGSLHKYGIPVILNQALYQVVQQKIEQHINRGKEIASIYNAVSGYLRQIDLPNEQREKLLSIITERTNYSPKTDYIYINPDPQDYKTFFADHFSLNSEILRNTVQSGFRSAISTLRKLDI